MKEGFKVYFIYLITPLLFLTIFSGFVKSNSILANIIFYLVLLLFFLIHSKSEIKKNFKDFKINFKKYLPIILKWVVIGFILMIVSNYIIQLFVSKLPNNEINNRTIIKTNPFLSLIYLLLIAPMLEEYVFRFSFRDIKNYYFYTILTSLLFSSLHLLSASTLRELWYFIPYFVFSLGFSNIFFKTKNYFASIFGHIIHNTICVIIILLF